MKKKRWIPGILLALFLGMGTVSLAADAGPTVTFDGKQIVYSNYEVTDFGDAFDNMLPSETRTQEIILKNADQRAVDFYMSAQVLKSLQEIGEDNAFYHVSLDLVQNGTSTRIYGEGQELATVGGSNNGARGLKELDDTLDERMPQAFSHNGFPRILCGNLYYTCHSPAHRLSGEKAPLASSDPEAYRKLFSRYLSLHSSGHCHCGSWQTGAKVHFPCAFYWLPMYLCGHRLSLYNPDHRPECLRHPACNPHKDHTL